MKPVWRAYELFGNILISCRFNIGLEAFRIDRAISTEMLDEKEIIEGLIFEMDQTRAKIFAEVSNHA